MDSECPNQPLKFLCNHSQYGAISKLIFQADAWFYCENDQFIQIVTDAAVMGVIQNKINTQNGTVLGTRVYKTSAKNI